MSLLRDVTPALAAALANGVPLFRANLFRFALTDGMVYRWTDWTDDLAVGSQIFTSGSPWVKRGAWKLANTMEVPSMDLTIIAKNDAFAGGANVKAQAHNGLFDGAEVLYSKAYMLTPGETTALGVIDLFSGISGPADIDGATISLTIKGKNNRLNAGAPRNQYQSGCLHTFCDIGCALKRAAYTTTHIVGTTGTPSRTFLPWADPPADYVMYKGGTVTMTSGLASGQSRTILAATAEGLTLIYPLYAVPMAGDSFSAFQGCDKTRDSCQRRLNLQHWRAFPFVPPAETAI